MTGKVFSKRGLPLLMALLVVLTVTATPAFALNPQPLPPSPPVDNNQIVMHFHIGRTDSDINGQAQPLDTAPIISKGRTFLPIKFVAGPLGAKTSWDPSQKMVTVTLGNTTIQLWIGKDTAMVNGASIPIDPSNPSVTPMIVKGRTLLPLAFIAANLGCKVNWNASTQEVTVTWLGSLLGASGTLSSLTAGDTVHFAGYTWIVLDPSTGYLLMQGAYGSAQPFDSNLSNVTFGISSTTNIAYYLNAAFYNSLSPADQALIQSHSWTTGNETNESSGSVTCYIGLISYSEYKEYVGNKSIYWIDDYWWTRTPFSANPGSVWVAGGMGGLYVMGSFYTAAVVPALYLNPSISVSGGNGGTITSS